VQTVLFVGAGPRQQQAIRRSGELGFRVVAVEGEVEDVEALAAAGRRGAVDGVLTAASARALPVAAAVADELGLPGMAPETVHAAANKIALRRLLAEHGVPQPRFAAARTLSEARKALSTVGLPAVLKPADSCGQRGLFALGSEDDLDAHLHAALAESESGEVLLESFEDGLELEGPAVARSGAVLLLTLWDRLRPPGIGFGVGWLHVHPATIFGDSLEEAERVGSAAIHAVGLHDGLALVDLLALDDGRVLALGVKAGLPGGHAAVLARRAVGVDLVEVALRQAVGTDVSDELVTPDFRRPLAVRSLTASPGHLPTGRVRRVGGLERVRAMPGVVEAEVLLEEGETIRPVRAAADRRGHVAAVGETSLEALERAEAAAAAIEVEVDGGGPA
jgi:biotin carboxylase